jgi:hypothetical protein
MGIERSPKYSGALTAPPAQLALGKSVTGHVPMGSLLAGDFVHACVLRFGSKVYSTELTNGSEAMFRF